MSKQNSDQNNEENIYKDLEIKDYADILEFIEDVVDRNTLSSSKDGVMIIGGRRFIHVCVKLLQMVSDFYSAYKDYMLGCIEFEWDSGNDNEEYALTIQNECGFPTVDAERVRYEDEWCRIGIKRGLWGWFDYTRIFLNQDYVQQDLVDECLRTCEEVTLFGIDERYEDLDESDNELECNENCPWWGECNIGDPDEDENNN